ncbi:ATP-binding protein [Escherichia coli]
MPSQSLHGARVYIDVINTGTPIPQEERAMIFEPSSRKPPAKRGGEGQRSAWSIARDCIRRMQGELYLVDESGQDVCFRIELPSSKNTK